MSFTLGPAESEARRLLQTAGSLRSALEVLMSQFTVLQTRAQILLTVSTLALTITGFSGPKIAAAGDFQRYALAVGLVFVLASTLLILMGSLRIRWVTQFDEENDEALVTAIVRYRDSKTRLFFLQLCLLVTGLACYVSGVVSYFLIGAP
jgi:hypothetical protein